MSVRPTTPLRTALACSAAVVALPTVASAAPVATQTYDIWNLTSSAITVTGYEKAPSYLMVPQQNLPKDTVIPIGGR